MSKSKALFFVLAALAAALLPVCAYLRIATCSTGADPQIFISLAHDILDHRFAEVAAFVVPGWPLYLAAIIRFFGPFAACWANVPLFVLLVFALWLLLSDLLASRVRGALAALFSAIALLAGFVHNPHFLLWSFRQTPIYLASLLSLLFVRRATRAAFDRRPRPAFAWLLASLAAALAATLVRETSALLLPVLFLHLLLDSGAPASLPPDAPPPPFRRRLPLLIAFCALNLAALIAGLAAVFLLRLNVFNSQNLYILRSLEPLLRDHLFSASHMSRSLLLVLGEFPWLLGLCLLFGVLAACIRRRFRPFATLFLVPALLNFLFEAFHKIHMRFFLTPVFYLAPLAALGAFVLFDALRRFLSRRRHAAHAAGGTSLKTSFILLALLAVWGVFVVRSMLPWGPRVSPAQVRQCLQAIEAASPSPDSTVLLDPRSRYLREILRLFSSRPLLDVTPETLASLDLSSPALFVRPEDRESFHSSVLALDATQLLEFHADLTPVSAPDGAPATLFVGPFPHTLYVVSAPATSSVDLPVPTPPPLPPAYPYSFVFLRVGAPLADPDAPISAALVPASAPDAPVLLAPALRSGWNDLPVPVALLSPGESCSLRLSSPKPFPVTLPVSWNSPNALHYEFGLFMYPRHDILSPEFHEFDDLKQPDPPFPTWPVGARTREFDKPGTIELPADFDGRLPDAPPVPSVFAADFVLSAIHPLPDETLTATVSFPDVPSIPPQSADIPASPYPSTVSFAWGNLPSNRLPSRLRLELPAHPRVRELYPANRRSSSSRIHSMDLKRIPLRDNLFVRFGDLGDDELLRSGFYPRGNRGTCRQGRWLADQAEVLLPIPPADCLLVMDVDLAGLPPEVAASRPADFTATLDGNPIPLDFAPAGDLPPPEETDAPRPFRVSAAIPASAFSDPNGVHVLRFSAPPFCPPEPSTAAPGPLSLFAQALSVTPLHNLQIVDSAVPSPASPILLDPRSRTLRELLCLASPRPVLDATPETLAALDLSTPALFLRPMDQQAFAPGSLALDATQLLEFHAVMTPVANPDGSPATLFVGTSPHRLFTVSAPAGNSVDLPVPPPPSLRDGYPYPSVFLRVGVPPVHPDAPLSASLLRASAPSAPVLLSPSLRSGWNDLPVPVALLAPGESFTLRLSSSAPVPSTLPVSWNAPDALHYEFGLFMYPRHDILSPEFHEFDDLKHPDSPAPAWRVAPRIREFDKPGTIELPDAFDGHLPDAPPVPSVFRTDFVLSALHDLPGETLTATVSFPDVPSIPPQSAEIPAGPADAFVSFSWVGLPSNRLPSRLRLELPAHPRVRELYPANRRSSSSRLHTMDLKRIPLRDAFSVRFGDPADLDPHGRLEGFFRPEFLGTPRQGCWMAAEADVLLPLAPASYSLSLDVDLSSLPASVRASRPSDFSATANGHPVPLEFAPVDNPDEPHVFRVTAAIPASVFPAPDGLFHLHFSAPPFRPSDRGLPDPRALALFIRSLSLSPLP